MSKRYNTIIIEDLQFENLSEDRIIRLIECFKYSLKSIVHTLVRRAEFNCADFYTSKIYGLQTVKLVIERKIINGMEQWHANFKDTDNANKRLSIIATLGDE